MTSLRQFNVFDPGQNPSSDYAAVIPKFIKAIKTGGHHMLYGDGGQKIKYNSIRMRS
jgi:UDP-glucose 4-epimerase